MKKYLCYIVLAAGMAFSGKSFSADSSYVQTEKISFAQVWEANESTVKVQTQEKTAADKNNEQETLQDSKKKAISYSIVKATPYKVEPPFEGAEDNFKALAAFDAAYDLLSTAQRLHNVKKQLPTLRQPFVEYTKMKLLHDKAIDALIKSDKIIGGYRTVRDGEEKNVKGYLSSYYDDETASDIWYGQNCRLKEIPDVQICDKVYGCKSSADYVQSVLIKIVCSDGTFDVTDYGKRRGLSGYAISAFKLAKADQVLELDKDSFGTPLLDLDQSTDISELEKKQSISDVMSDADEIVSPNDEAYADETLREQDLIRWQIGSEVAASLGADMDRSDPNYGFAIKKYPMWVDDKRFYDQYLEEKYKNMVAYFDSSAVDHIIFDLAAKVNESLELQDEFLNLKQQNAEVISEAFEDFKKQSRSAEEETPILMLKKSQDETMRQLVETYHKNLNDLKAQKQKIYDQIDDQSERLNEVKQEYNNLKGKEKDFNSLTKLQSLSIEASEERAKKSPTYVTGIKDEAEAIQTLGKAEADEALKKADSVLEQVEVYQEEITRLKENAEKIDEQIKELTEKYIKEATETEAAHFKAIKNALNERNNADLDYDVDEVSSLNPLMSFTFDTAWQMIRDYKKEAAQYVKEAYKQILDLGQDIYDPAYYEKIQNIHKNMLQNIKNINVAPESPNVVLSGVVVGYIGELKNVADTISQFVFKSDCDELGCENEDEQYYVSLDVKIRDFTAPKRIALQRQAPLREAFHFDAIDYDSVLKTKTERLFIPYPEIKKPRTTRGEFLNLKQKMPEIWKRILMPDGFVERDVDIEKILNNQKGENAENTEVTLPKELPGKFLRAKGEYPVTGDFSELSVFFKYDDGLMFTDEIYKLYEYFAELQNSDKEIDTDELHDHEQMFLTRDQIGDYLQFVDMEQMYQTNMAQLKVKTDEVRQTVNDAISPLACTYLEKGTGFVMKGDASATIVSSEFIADDETYEAILKCLNDGKDRVIREALSLLSDLPPLNETLADRKEKLDNMLKTLQKDSEELVSLSDNMIPDAAFEQKIKSAQADGAVLNKYGDEAMSEFERNLEEFEKPYRAKYF